MSIFELAELISKQMENLAKYESSSYDNGKFRLIVSIIASKNEFVTYFIRATAYAIARS